VSLSRNKGENDTPDKKNPQGMEEEIMTEVDLRHEAVMEQMMANEPMFHVGTKEIGGVELKVFDNAPASMRDFFAIGAALSPLRCAIIPNGLYRSWPSHRLVR
jgi:hypothetical protein